VVEQAVLVVGLLGLDILDSRGQKFEHGGHFVSIDVSSLLHVETDASESYPAAPSPHSPEDDVVRETIVAVGAGSSAKLREVQIGSIVEGEDEGGLACYKSWKSVKR
jgi:hypothetical protein